MRFLPAGIYTLTLYKHLETHTTLLHNPAVRDGGSRPRPAEGRHRSRDRRIRHRHRRWAESSGEIYGKRERSGGKEQQSLRRPRHEGQALPAPPLSERPRAAGRARCDRHLPINSTHRPAQGNGPNGRGREMLLHLGKNCVLPLLRHWTSLL